MHFFCFVYFGEKVVQRVKGAFLKTMKIEIGTNSYLFIKVRHWDPLKMVPASGFEKNEKSLGKSMVFDGPTSLEIIEKHILFLKFGHSPKR